MEQATGHNGTIISLGEIIAATGGEALSRGRTDFSGVSIDSRSARAGDLFFALPGVRFDGHDFVDAVLRAGAGAVVQRPPDARSDGKTVVLVKDSLRALQDLARWRAARLDVPVVGITGTNGKTTTKELVAAILSRKHRVLKTAGNLNNHIGLPLCVARMRGDETVMVLEMGSSARGDIRDLCEIVRPGFAVITNVGPAHLEGFGSMETVRDTDLEILAYASLAAVNGDDRFLLGGIRDFRGTLLTYGAETDADTVARDIVFTAEGTSFRLDLGGRGTITVRLRIPGLANVSNALAAASITAAMGMELEDIRHGLESFRGVPMRLEIHEKAGMTIIVDAYNANPLSVREAVRELSRRKGQRAIAVLGDMLELGDFSQEAHRNVVSSLSAENIDILVAVGPEMSAAAAGFSGISYLASDAEEARSILSALWKEGDTILVKGSRGMRMELVLETPACLLRGGDNAP